MSRGVSRAGNVRLVASQTAGCVIGVGVVASQAGRRGGVGSVVHVGGWSVF